MRSRPQPSGALAYDRGVRLTSSLGLRRSLLALAAASALTLAGCAASPAAPEPLSQSGEAPTPAGACSYPETKGRPAAKPVDAPNTDPTHSGAVAATVSTSVGDLAVTLDADATPCTVNSFLSLAEQGYFDDTSCHRLTVRGIYVLQCGDPSASGTGGPGYSFPDELTGSETYGAGTLAMANSGRDTNGSQFFVVYAPTDLPPNYTVFGQLDEASTQIVAEVAKAGTETGGPDGAPKTPVTITGITLK